MKLILIVATVMILIYLYRQNNSLKYKPDIGLFADISEAEEAEHLLAEGNYKALEELLRAQETNNLSYVLGYLAFSATVDQLENWEKSGTSDLPVLTLGVYHLHKAWRLIRGAENSRISEVTHQNFLHLLEVADQHLEQIKDGSPYLAEILSYKISLKTGQKKPKEAKESFLQVKALSPQKIWPYLYYSSFIQSQWFGTEAEVLSFYNTLPKVFLLNTLVKLKLVCDADQMGKNYWQSEGKELKTLAGELSRTADKNLIAYSEEEVFTYLLYRYLAIASEIAEDQTLGEKYRKLLDSKKTPLGMGYL